MTRETEIRLARDFFDMVYDGISDMDDTLYEFIDPEVEHEDLCDRLNNDTIKEVLALGFRQKYGVDWHDKENKDENGRTQ